jgi:hypothetical protein
MTTAGSSGLNNLTSSTCVVQTTLPSWYCAAQQKVASGAATAAACAPTFQQSTSQQAVNTLTGANNPYTQSQNALSSIASGAANPWITSACGAVTPNTSTALGGLFAAQNQQLNQILPTVTAGANAAGIGSGNFMSSQGQGAVETAKANAQANLLAQQMTAALNNQQTGTTAATGLGNVGTQAICAALKTGTAQQNAPFQTIGNYANLINSLNVPGTVQSQKQLSALCQAATLGTAAQSGLSALAATSTGSNLLKTLGLCGLVKGTSTAATTLPAGVPTGATLATDGSGNYTYNGQTYSPTGTLIDTSGSTSSGTNPVNATVDPTTGQVTSAGCACAYGAG